MKPTFTRGGPGDSATARAADPLTGLLGLVDLLTDRVAGLMLERLSPLLRGDASDDDELLSYQQVADLLTTMDPPVTDDVKRPTAEYVASLVARGELVGTPLPGKYRRVRRGDYRAFVARRRTRGVEDGADERYAHRRGAEKDSPSLPLEPRTDQRPGQRGAAPARVGVRPRRPRRAPW